jgi:aminopeptidase N
MKVLFTGISYTTLRDDDYGVYTFKSNNKVPTYMFSLVAGDLGITQVGNQTAVWSETILNQMISEQFISSESYLKQVNINVNNKFRLKII